MINHIQQIGYFESVNQLLELPAVLISNTTFMNILFHCSEKLIELQGAVLHFEGPVVFTHFYHRYNQLSTKRGILSNRPAIISLADFHSMVIFHNYIDISNNEVSAFDFKKGYYGDDNTNKFVIIKENSFLNMANCSGPSFMTISMSIPLKNTYNIFNNLLCFFNIIVKGGTLIVTSQMENT